MIILNKENGITLIALVVTIVVLLILAGVSLNLVIGNNGIITKAQDAKIKTEIGKEKEILGLSVLQAKGDVNFADIEAADLEICIDSYLSEGESNVIDNMDGTFLVIFPSQRAYDVDVNGDITIVEDYEIPNTENVVARIKYQYYSTLQDAIDAVPEDKSQTTIIMLKEVSENVVINENKNIILDLKEKSITNSGNDSIITLSGDLIIKNGTVKGTYTDEIPTIYTNENSNLYISESTIDRSSGSSYAWETIQLYGNLDMDSGTVNNPNSNAICTYEGSKSIININGGNVYSTNANTINNHGILHISEGTITCNSTDSAKSLSTIYNRADGTLVVSGGFITTEKQGNGDYPTKAIYNEGNLEIKENANINGGMAVWPAIYNATTGNTIINGGYIYSYGCTAITNAGTFELNDGYIKSRQAGNSCYATLVIKGGNVSLLGGTIEHLNNYCTVYKASDVEASVTIDGCTLIGMKSGV